MNELPETLTMEDLAFLPELEDLSREELQALLEKLDELYDSVDAEEPDEESEAYDEWLEDLEEIDDWRDAVQEELDSRRNGITDETHPGESPIKQHPHIPLY